MTRPMRPAAIRIHPITLMSIPLMSALTANAKIAPNASRKILPPMPIAGLLDPHRGQCVEKRFTHPPETSIRQAGRMTARTLVLLRHAKAETPGDLIDFDRKLTTKGETDADAAGAWLADERWHPGLVLCSPAARTRQTWQGVSI